MFGRATITLGIGPHSSFIMFIVGIVLCVRTPREGIALGLLRYREVEKLFCE